MKSLSGNSVLRTILWVSTEAIRSTPLYLFLEPEKYFESLVSPSVATHGIHQVESLLFFLIQPTLAVSVFGWVQWSSGSLGQKAFSQKTAGTLAHRLSAHWQATRGRFVPPQRTAVCTFSLPSKQRTSRRRKNKENDHNKHLAVGSCCSVCSVFGYCWWCNDAVTILWTNQYLQCIYVTL